MRHWVLGLLWPTPRSCHPGHGSPEFSSSTGCLKTTLATISLATSSPHSSILGVLAVQALAIQHSTCFCPQQTCHVRQGEQEDCAGQQLLPLQKWDEETAYLRKPAALAGAAVLSAALAGLQDPLCRASGL